MVTLVYLVFELFPLSNFCISQHLCHFILEAFLVTIPLKMLVHINLFKNSSFSKKNPVIVHGPNRKQNICSRFTSSLL